MPEEADPHQGCTWKHGKIKPRPRRRSTLGCFWAHSEGSAQGPVWTHLLLLCSSWGSGRPRQPDSLCRAHPDLESASALKPQNPETHFNSTVTLILDPEPETKPVGATSSFFKKRKTFCGEGKNACTRGPRGKAPVFDVAPLGRGKIKSYFATTDRRWAKSRLKRGI